MEGEAESTIFGQRLRPRRDRPGRRLLPSRIVDGDLARVGECPEGIEDDRDVDGLLNQGALDRHEIARPPPASQ